MVDIDNQKWDLRRTDTEMGTLADTRHPFALVRTLNGHSSTPGALTIEGCKGSQIIKSTFSMSAFFSVWGSCAFPGLTIPNDANW